MGPYRAPLPDDEALLAELAGEDGYSRWAHAHRRRVASVVAVVFAGLGALTSAVVTTSDFRLMASDVRYDVAGRDPIEVRPLRPAIQLDPAWGEPESTADSSRMRWRERCCSRPIPTPGDPLASKEDLAACSEAERTHPTCPVRRIDVFPPFTYVYRD